MGQFSDRTLRAWLGTLIQVPQVELFPNEEKRAIALRLLASADRCGVIVGSELEFRHDDVASEVLVSVLCHLVSPMNANGKVLGDPLLEPEWVRHVFPPKPYDADRVYRITKYGSIYLVYHRGFFSDLTPK